MTALEKINIRGLIATSSHVHTQTFISKACELPYYSKAKTKG